MKRIWAGRILSALAVAFLLWDAIMKLMRPQVVLESFARLGYPEGVAMGIGILQLVCIIVYVIPRTSVLGAILLTGYLGGAVTTHVRVGDPLFSHVLFPTYIGVLLWAGLYPRDARLRALIPLRRAEGSPHDETAGASPPGGRSSVEPAARGEIPG